MATTEPKTHDLKCWPEYFEAVADGRKPFEIREDDRGYLKGDILHLREWCPQTEQYTGQSCQRQVTYILRSSTHNQIEYSVRRNFVVMGLADPQHPIHVEADRIRNAAAKQEQDVIDILGPLLGFPTGPFPEVCSDCKGGPCAQVERCSTYCLSAPYVAEELAATVAKELVTLRGKDVVPRWVPVTEALPRWDDSNVGFTASIEVTMLYFYFTGERMEFPKAYHTDGTWYDQYGNLIDLEFGAPAFWLHNPIPAAPTIMPAAA